MHRTTEEMIEGILEKNMSMLDRLGEAVGALVKKVVEQESRIVELERKINKDG